jgi:hypothetical protein
VSYYQLGATSADVTPKSSIDLVATWGAIKDRMRAALGEYKFGDGSLMTFQGQRCPMVTVEQANTVLEWFARIGAKMTAAASAAGRSTARMDVALAAYRQAITRFKGHAQNSSGGRLPLDVCFMFIEAVNNYAIAMSAAQYTAFNTGTSAELITQALNETPGGSALLGIWDAAKATIGAGGFILGNLGTILKLALVGGAGLVGWKIYKKVRP